jgi:hypothetical protein
VALHDREDSVKAPVDQIRLRDHEVEGSGVAEHHAVLALELSEEQPTFAGPLVVVEPISQLRLGTL